MVAGFLALSAETSVADETGRWARMLEGFKDPQRRYYDTALEYLRYMEANPNCPESLREQLDYQRARIHQDVLESGVLFLSRQEHLDRQREALTRFVEEHPDHNLYFDAQLMLGRLYLEQGRAIMLRLVESFDLKEDRQKELRLQARSEFQRAASSFEAALARATEQAKELQEAKKAKEDSVSQDALLTAYGRFLSSRLLSCLVKVERAQTYPQDSGEYQDDLNEAAESFLEMARKYSEFSAGLEAKLYAAKTYKELGNVATARQLLSELNTLDGDEFLPIQAGTLLLTLELNLAEEKRPSYQDSIQRGRKWLEKVPDSILQSRQGQEIILTLAKNLIAYANTLQDNKQEQMKWNREATDSLRRISPDFPVLVGEAQSLLQRMGVVTDQVEPENFEQAQTAVEQAWKDFSMALFDFQRRAREEHDEPDQESNQRLEALAENCFIALSRAVDMRRPDTPIGELNALRLKLVQIYRFRGKAVEAALIADYLTRHYSGMPDAEKTALAAARLYRRAFASDEFRFEATADRLDRLCDYIQTRWPGTPLVDETRLLRIETAIDLGNVESAQELLSQTAPESPQRISAELRIGLSLWNRYVIRSKAEKSVPPDEADTLRDAARKQLEIGLSGTLGLIGKGTLTVDNTALRCVMALARLEIDGGASGQALRWLNDPLIGPLTLADSPPETVDAELLAHARFDGMALALRAYVALEDLDKAEETMNRLDKIVQEQELDDQRVNRIYVSLGQELQRRLKELHDSGRRDEAAQIARGFELFLDRIKDRGRSNPFQTLYWVAETFQRLGMAAMSDRTGSSGAADYFRQASETYELILKRMEEEPDWATSQALDTIRLRRLESLRYFAESSLDAKVRISLLDQAMNELESILDRSENRIAFQVEAARTLEAWGRDERRLFGRAVSGGFPSRKIWGWNGLIRRSAKDLDRHAETYYEAWIHKFQCVLEVIAQEKNDARKMRYLSGVERDLTGLVLRRPELGGPERYAAFDSLYRRMRKARGNVGPPDLESFIALRNTKEPAVATEPVSKQEESKESKTAAGKKSGARSSFDELFPLWLALGSVILIVPAIGYVAFRPRKRRSRQFSD